MGRSHFATVKTVAAVSTVIVGGTAKRIAVQFFLYHIERIFCSILIQIHRRDGIPRVQVRDLCERENT